MKQFKYVEDYLELIAGVRDIATGKVAANSVWTFTFQPIINLARYDVKVLESMAMTTLDNKPLTVRQGDLACKIIVKYERQLASKGIDVAPVTHPTWRISLREMDYSRKLLMKDNQLVLKFPFDTELINSIKEFQKESQGSTKFDRESKVWTVGLTEYNVSWIYTWATQQQFEIDHEVVALMNLITAVEQQEYRIELYVESPTQLNITNAPTSLYEYVVDKLGGFGIDNLLTLIDHSGILGYTVESALAEAMIADNGPRFYNLITHKEMKIKPSTVMTTDDFESIFNYSRIVGRTPIVIYEPDLSSKLLQKAQQIFPTTCYENKNNKKPTIDFAQFDVIHTVTPILNMERIPLLISGAGMMFGGDKQLMLQRAEKVVYCSTEVYNKKNVNSKVKDLAG